MFRRFWHSTLITSSLAILALVCPSQLVYGQDKLIEGCIERLQGEVFNNCIVKFGLDGSSSVNGKPQLVGDGSIVFARMGSSLFVDSMSRTWDADKSRPNETQSEQMYMADGARAISVLYNMKKQKPTIVAVSCDPSHTYDQEFGILTRKARLDDILAEFGSCNSTLSGLVKKEPDTLERDGKGKLLAKYSTKYGLVILHMVQAQDSFVLRSASIEQSATSIYNSRFAQPLSSVKKSMLGKHAEGLTSCIHTVEFDYSSEQHAKPFDVMRITDKLTSGNKSWVGQSKFTLVSYTKASDLRDIDTLKIKIPDGQKVHSLDPKYKPLNFAYRRGEVVRRVDGASLNQVVAEHGKTSRLFWVVVVLCTVFAISVTVVGVRRGYFMKFFRKKP